MRMLSSLSCVLGIVLANAGLVRADDQADARTLIDKAIKAAGGEAKLAKFQAMIWKGKGKYHPDNQPFTGTWSYQAPGRMRSEIQFEDVDQKVITVVDGDKGWTKVEETEALEGDAMDEERENIYANWLTLLVPLKDKTFQLALLGESKVGDRAVIGLKVVHKDHRDVKLFFDKASYLLLKEEMRVKDVENDKEVDEEMIYSGYKEVEGTQQAMKVKIKWDGQPKWDMEITEIKLLEKLGDSVFAKP